MSSSGYVKLVYGFLRGKKAGKHCLIILFVVTDFAEDNVGHLFLRSRRVFNRDNKGKY